MGEILISVRGYVQPCLLAADVTRGAIRRIDVPVPELDEVPVAKRGFAGVAHADGVLVAATWDRLCWLDPSTGAVLRHVTDPRFSDLHGIYVDGESVWVTSTNLDGVYQVRGDDVRPFWHAWQERELGATMSWREADYRRLSKHEVPYHRLHVNGVFVRGDQVIVSYLGPAAGAARWKRAMVATGLRRHYRREGGVIVLDRRTARLVEHLRCEGLHDTVLGPDGRLHFTEYFGGAVASLDLGTLALTRVALEAPPSREWGYLTRGVLFDGDTMLIGHTQLRGWKTEHPVGLVRRYRRDGSFTGEELRLPGFVGPYALLSRTV